MIGNVIKKIFGVIWNIIQVLIIVYVVFVTSCILCRNKFGFTQFDNYSWVSLDEDNYKRITDGKDGNLLVVKKSSEINKGDVIYYYAAINDHYVVCSGVVDSLTSGDDTSLYVLKDKDKTTVPSTRVLGKYANQYPKIGKILNILESRFGFLLLVLLPIMIVFIYQIYEFIVTLKYEKVEDDDKKDNEKKEVKVEDVKKEETPVEVKSEEKRDVTPIKVEEKKEDEPVEVKKVEDSEDAFKAIKNEVPNTQDINNSINDIINNDNNVNTKVISSVVEEHNDQGDSVTVTKVVVQSNDDDDIELL